MFRLNSNEFYSSSFLQFLLGDLQVLPVSWKACCNLLNMELSVYYCWLFWESTACFIHNAVRGLLWWLSKWGIDRESITDLIIVRALERHLCLQSFAITMFALFLLFADVCVMGSTLCNSHWLHQCSCIENKRDSWSRKGCTSQAEWQRHHIIFF